MQPDEGQAWLPPAVVVHGYEQARTALAPGLPVLLLSALGAAAYAGAGWWRSMIDQALAAHGGPGAPRPSNAPDALDCSDLAGRALEALSVGCRIIVLHPCPAYPAIVERAGLVSARVLSARPPALDLAEPGAERRVTAWLARSSAGGGRMAPTGDKGPTIG